MQKGLLKQLQETLGLDFDRYSLQVEYRIEIKAWIISLTLRLTDEELELIANGHGIRAYTTDTQSSTCPRIEPELVKELKNAVDADLEYALAKIWAD